MKVFVTGGTGYLGRPTVRRLSGAGHEVMGLVRRPDKGSQLREDGGTPVYGDLESPDTYKDAAAACDAVIHLASEAGPRRAAADRTAVESLLAALRAAHGPKAFVYTSVLFVLGPGGGRIATEETTPRPPEYARYKAEQERLVLQAASAKLATTVVRPGMVYGGGAGGAVSELFRSALTEGRARYVGDGANRWSLVHRDDLAALFQLVIEHRAQGILHAVDEHPLSVRKVARYVTRASTGEKEGRGIPLEEARTELGAFADALCLDLAVAAPRATAHGWQPSNRSFRQAVGAALVEWQAERE